VQLTHEEVKAHVQHMLSVQLKVEEQALSDDFRWLEAMGHEDAGYFLADVNDAFIKIRPGFSVGEGRRPFSNVDAACMEQVATVGGLIKQIELHLGIHSRR